MLASCTMGPVFSFGSTTSKVLLVMSLLRISSVTASVQTVAFAFITFRVYVNGLFNSIISNQTTDKYDDIT